ncbi:MAG: non-ribosomal peptide synthetase [Lachnospiraceae bacterium]|nr:non-ribosomal peptide synthetase [Lachnospiraceae bacterium]
MRLKNIGKYHTINQFIRYKLGTLDTAEQSFKGLFPLMFSEDDNIFFEKTENGKIVKTTYGEARREILRREKAVRALLKGAPQDAAVGFYMQNSVEWLIDFWAILAAGFSPVLLNLRLEDGSLEDALKSSEACAVISEGKRFSLRTIIEEELLEVAERVAGSTEPEMPAGPFGTHFYIMTSGTSSSGRLCAYSAEGVFEILRNSRKILIDSRFMQKHYKGELKHLCFLPFYHSFGMIAVYLWFGFYARTFVHLLDMKPETILATVRRHEITHIFAVPLFWNKVYEAAIRAIRDQGEETYARFEKGMALMDRVADSPRLSHFLAKKLFAPVREKLFGESIAFLISGGGNQRTDVLRFFNHIGYHMAEGYGMSEIGITSVELSEKPSLLMSGSVGRPFESMVYEVRDGRLLVRGSSMADYVITAGVRRNIDGKEWFETGDLVEEKEGHYYILGREDDLIPAENGENLNPNMIEERALVPGAEQACLVSIRENDHVKPVMILKLPAFSGEDPDAVREACYARLKELKLSEAIERVVLTKEELIQGNEFKLNRKRIARDLQAGKLREAGAFADGEMPDDELFLKLRALYAEALDKEPEEVGFLTDFFLEEGGSSLDFLTLLSTVQRDFGITLPIAEQETAFSLRDVYEYMKKTAGTEPRENAAQPETEDSGPKEASE